MLGIFSSAPIACVRVVEMGIVSTRRLGIACLTGRHGQPTW